MPTAVTGHEIGVSNHVVKVIEVLAESPHSWEDATRVALREAARTIRNISSIYIQDMQAVVRDGHVTAFRVNAKVSFVINAPAPGQSDSPGQHSQQTMGEDTMRQRRDNPNHEGENRPSRHEAAHPDQDDYGLHGQERRTYRGRESYEQQSRGGEGGRSGMFDNRYIARDRDVDDAYRANYQEDQRGYQNIGSRHEFQSGGRARPEYAMRPRDERDDEPRYGFDERDYFRGPDRERWESQGGRNDYNPIRRYGMDADRDRDRDRDRFESQGGGQEYNMRRRYGPAPDRARDRFESQGYRSGGDDYSSTDYGMRSYRNRESREFRDYGSPYAGRPSYEEQAYRPGAFSNRSGGRGSYSEPSYDQGRYASSQYDPQTGHRRENRGPKGYKRSDERIREDVCDRLSHQWDVDASEVEVQVSNGEVTLTGSIADREQKFRVEHIADGVGGVNEVHNQLRVKRESGAQAASQLSPNVRNGAANQSRSS